MARAFLPLLCALLPLVAAAQFDTPDTVFRTNVPRPFTIAMGDMDADADLDVVVNGWDSLYWFANDGTGQFPARHVIDGCYRGPISAKDIDNDGDVDIVACGDAWPYDGDWGWYANDGAGHFTPMSLIAPWMDDTFAPQWADLDGDGDVDLVSRGDTTLRIRFNDGGVFTEGPGLDTASYGYALSISVHDADGDGDNDLLVFGDVAERGYYENLGGGSFAEKVEIPDAGVDHVAAAWDKDGDGDLDLLLYTRWLVNDGSAQYTAGDTLGNAQEGTVADADADGDPDFFWLTPTFMNVWHGRNDGDSIAAIEIDHMNVFGNINDIRTGDINGDGQLDVLVCNQQGMLCWYAGDGAGQWGPRNTIGSPLTLSVASTAADLDLDGDVDIITTGSQDNRMAWYRNDGTGQLGAQEVIADNMGSPRDIEVFDIDMDGDSDIVLFNFTSSTVIRARNDGSGQFTLDTVAVQADLLAVGDLNGDPYPDLVAGDAWYANDGNGNFSLMADLGSVYVFDVACGDMDGDGQDDIVYRGYDIHVVKDISGSTYTDVVTPAPAATDIALADLDLDGDLDVASISGGNNNYWFENDGNGSFTQHTWFTAGFTMGACDLVATDVSGDGAPDILWAQGNNNGWMYLALNDGQGGFGPSQVVSADASYAFGLADGDGDLVPDIWSAPGGYITWQRNLFFVPFRLRGAIFKDRDLDALKDTLEPGLPYRLVRTDATDVLVWTNSAGEYDLPADTGTWLVWAPHSSYYSITNDPDTLGATLTTQEPVRDGLDLGLAPAASDTSAELGLAATSNLLRCNSDEVVWVDLQNTSVFVPQDIVIEVTLHPDLAVGSFCNAPDSVAGDHYYWHLDSLDWFQFWSTCIHLTTGSLGMNSAISAVATYGPGLLLDGPHQVGDTITCAFDPNDKLVTPAGYGVAGAVPIDLDRFTYTVRFQNTGTDTAFTVVIKDVLDPDLAWESMQVLAASHPLTVISVDENGEATFRFDQIMLPDSNVNEPASHGFIRYSIAPIEGAPHGTVITNTADILFDLNAPVTTNTTLNTLVDCGLFSATIIPNGNDVLVASDGLAWQWFLDGAPLPGANGPVLTIVGSGVYTVQVISEHGCMVVSAPYAVIGTSVTDAAPLKWSLWPDPAHDRLFVKVPGQATTIRMMDPAGRVVRTMQLSPGINTVSVEGLGPGAYTLRSVKGEVLRFVKQ